MKGLTLSSRCKTWHVAANCRHAVPGVEMISDEDLEQLRYKGEGADLDFKQAQYSFAKDGRTSTTRFMVAW